MYFERLKIYIYDQFARCRCGDFFLISRQNIMDSKIRECLENLSQEAKELYLNDGRVQEIDGCPKNAFEFHRKFVSANKPALFKGAVSHWPAMTKWTDDYLR